MSVIAAVCSLKKKTVAPPRVSISVPHSMTLVCRRYLLTCFPLSTRSSHTVKPMPPTSTRAMTVPQTSQSSTKGTSEPKGS